MSFIKHRIDTLVGGDGTASNQGIRIHHLDIMRKLDEVFVGFHCDLAGRRGLWTPREKTQVGLYHMHRHVCSMDRGWATQWPQWKTKLGLVEVPLDYALAHDDLPVVKLSEGGKAELREQTVATVLRPKLKTVGQVGWAEVFYHLIGLKMHGLTARWLGKTFRVPMDWYSDTKENPVSHSFMIAKKKGYA